MNTMRAVKRTRAFGFAPGFTLVELMVAAVLGVIVLLAVSYAYIGNRYNYLMNAELSRMQESGRAALDVIARSLENAGFAGCRAAPGDVQVTSDVDADWVSWLKMGFLVDSGGGSVTGLDGYTPQLRVFGPLEMGVVAVTGEPGSDGKIPVRTGPTLSAMAQIILPGKSIPGGPMLISDCSQAYIFNGAIDAAGGTIMAGTSGLPSGHTYTTGAQVAMLGEGAPFYLAARNLGGSSTVTNRSGTPETVMALLGGGGRDQPLADGVAAFRVCQRKGERGQATEELVDAADKYSDDVTMVQIDLLLYSLNDRLLPEDTPQEYYLCGDADGSPSVTISATNHPTHLRRVHRLFSTSVALPNKIRNSETITADK